MNEIIALTEIDFVSVFLSVLMILTGVKAIVSLSEWMIDKLGIETRWTRQKRMEHELLINTSKNLAILQEKHAADMEKSDAYDAEMKHDIKNLTDMFIDKQINDYRWEIINLADKISGGKTVSRECLRHAISVYEKYERIIAEHDLVNGEVEISIKVITDCYRQHLKGAF